MWILTQYIWWGLRFYILSMLPGPSDVLTLHIEYKANEESTWDLSLALVIFN